MTYDFNATYGPLKVYDQRQDGACWSYSRGLAVAASVLMHTGHQPVWPDDGKSYPALTHKGWDEQGRYVGYEMILEDVTHTIDPVSQDRTKWDWTDPAVVRPYLDKAGFLLLGITNVFSVSAVEACPTLPIIRPNPELDDPAYAAGHAILCVGYTDDGLIIQNSWGLKYGCQGRAILSREWLVKWCDSAEKAVIDGYPAEGATKTPQPLSTRKKTSMFIARRTANSPVWAFTGGVRSWVQSWSVLVAQGYTQNDCNTLPGSNSIWAKAAVVGPLPPGGDT